MDKLSNEQKKCCHSINKHKAYLFSFTIEKISQYKPLLVIAIFTLIFSYIHAHESIKGNFMYGFMGYFFLFLSMFKFFNLDGFVNGFKTYDIIAIKFKFYAYLYPFIEFALGIAYLTNFYLSASNVMTAIIMAISGIGVLKMVLSGQKIKCACLGTTLNVPLGVISIIENFGMGMMALYMLLFY